MKRIIAEWALLFLLCCCTSACAQDNLLTNLEVVNRRITGTLDACFGAGTEYEQWETILAKEDNSLFLLVRHDLFPLSAF